MPVKHIKKHPLKFTTAVLIMLVAAAALFVPWKIIAQQKIIELLAQNGFEGSTLDITHIGLQSAQLENLRLSKDASPLFDKMTITFSPRDLLAGRVNHLAFSGLNMQLQQTPDNWLLNGAALHSVNATDKPAPLVIPVTKDEIYAFGLDAAELQNSTVHVTTPAYNAEAPLVIMFQKFPEAMIDVISKNAQLKASGITLNADQIHMKAELDTSDNKWKGAWQADNIVTRGQDNLFPTLTGSGNIEASANTITLDGRLDSADKTTRSSFQLSYPLGAPEKAQFHLISAAMPWNKGVLSVKNAIIPLNGKADIHVTLNVEHVPVNALMMMLTGKETNATGDVSGSIPVSIAHDGKISIGQGKLANEKPGVISLNPETIPGDNEQITLVRDVMKNLHYQLLSISMDSDKDNKLSVIMAVEGSNPDVVEGRPVKLNVHLTGDLLNFVQQSILSLIDPHTFLKQELHAK
ncbi:MAG: YdbH domain-containing protein [Alphaproteobacteria bacterium]|nr:YdbH domain-containing protein [Alphaproteobacteria bacterium]